MPDGAVVAPDTGVLPGPAGLDVPDGDALRLGPGRQPATDVVRAVARREDGLLAGHGRRAAPGSRSGGHNPVRDTLAEAVVGPVIPPKSNRRFPAEFDREICKWRRPIEKAFGKLREYSAIAVAFLQNRRKRPGCHRNLGEMSIA